MRRDERLILLLRRDLPQGNFIFELGPEKQEVWIDSKHQKHLPLRFYFVSQRKTCETGSLWVVFDHLESEPPKTQVLMNDVNRARSDILTNGHEYRHPFNPYKIAVIDKNTQIGPTFFAGYPHHLYVRYEFDSRFAREEWERSATSSCGGGPLSAVPQQWIDERTRDCKILDDRFERAQARWYVRLARRLRNL